MRQGQGEAQMCYSRSGFLPTSLSHSWLQGLTPTLESRSPTSSLFQSPSMPHCWQQDLEEVCRKYNSYHITKWI